MCTDLREGGESDVRSVSSNYGGHRGVITNQREDQKTHRSIPEATTGEKFESLQRCHTFITLRTLGGGG